jgi:diadenosine tetraphosphate (Ap4A) HIT family hydrolase
MKSDCLICDRIDKIKNNSNPFFVTELSSGYVVFCDFQFYKGYTIFLSKIHTNELHKLKNREIFLKEMAIVAEAVYKTFKPQKLNYELLGNSDEHLHWHIIPRYKNDLNPKSPIWVVDKKIRCAKNTIPKQNELDEMREMLIGNLPK